MEELDSTWKQMERIVQVDGFREGASEGQEKALEGGFDDGYEAGIRVGLLLGQQKGRETIAEYLKEKSTPHQTPSIQENCEICSRQPNKTGKTAMPESVEGISYSELKILQESKTNDLEEKLAANSVSSS